MANISNMFAAVALVLASLMLFSIPQIESLDLADETDPLAYAPTIDYVLPPLYPPQYQEIDIVLGPNDPDFPGFKTKNEVDELLLNCEIDADIDLKCGLDYHESVFLKDAKPAKACCKKLVKQGKICHDLLVKFILRFGGFNYNREKSLKRSERVWKHCSLVQ